MSTSNNDLNVKLSALVKYVLDVKPYHTKLLGFTSEVSFNDSLSLTLSDGLQHTIYHQNVWGSKDIPSLGFVSDGTDASKVIILPATVMPRFSVTDSVDYQQAPLGDDQTVADLTDLNADGVPDTAYPWPSTPTFSHQRGTDFIPVRLNVTSLTVTVTAATSTSYTATVTGSIFTAYPTAVGIPLNALELRVKDGPTVVVDASTGSFTAEVSGTYSQASIGPEPSLPTFPDTLLASAWLYRAGVELWAIHDTGRFYVPFHNGSKVRVNNVPQTFGAANDYIVDSTRSFIQFVAGKHPAAGDYVDINLFNADRLFISICDPFIIGRHGYDTFPYDSELYDLDAQADQFIITVNNFAPRRNIVTFANLQPGTSKAELRDVLIYPSQAHGSIWQLVADGLFSLTVQQVHPITGPIEHAIINEPFDNGKIAFTLRAPWVEYYLSSGPTSYVAYDMTLFDDDFYEGPPDEADFWPGNNIKAMYGQPIDPLPPLHPPVKFNPFGELKQRSVGGKPQFLFEFATAPSQGSFVELRVEQAKQLNPRLQLSMHEKLTIVQLADLAGDNLIVYDKTVYSSNEIDTSTLIEPPAVGLLRITEDGSNRISEAGEQFILES